MRGGERVLDRLARLFGPTELYTLVDDENPLTDAISACDVIRSPLQRFPAATMRWRRHYLPLMPWAVSQLRVKPCDLLISTSSAVMKSIAPPPSMPHLCYCHSPARYIWEQIESYERGAGGLIRSAGLRCLRHWFQEWDRRTADRVTKFLANSHYTAQRIERYYGREADVVWPPVRTSWFTPDPAIRREDWFLVVGALEPYKRTDLAIELANRTGLAFRVAGHGSQLKLLRARAGPTVTMLGRVSDHMLRDLYRRARALIFPQIEDFGIIAVEAQATGCPVIALRGGGVRDIISETTGIFFREQTVDALADSVRQFGNSRFDPQSCRANALRFSETAFDESILKHVSEML